MTQHSDQSPAEIADDLLMDGLLRSRHLDVQIDRERRIRALMSSIEDASAEQGGATHTWRPWRLATAAMIGVAVLIGILILDQQTTSAHAELWRSLEAMETRADLSFELRILGPDPGEKSASLAGSNRRRTTDGHLHIRDSKYVITRTLPDGSILAGGFDGEEHWTNLEHVNGNRARVVRGPVRRVEELLSRLSLNLAKELRRLRRMYEIGPPTVESDDKGRRLLHFVGIRRSPKESAGATERRGGPKAAARIDIWLDPTDRQIVQLELSGVPTRPDAPTIDLQLRAVTPPSFPNDYFDLSGHPTLDRAGGRPGRNTDINQVEPERRRRRSPEKSPAAARDA